MNNNNKGKTQLAQLYVQKGELITEIEIMQQQLRIVNQRIFQIKNAAMQEIKANEKMIVKGMKKNTGKDKNGSPNRNTNS